MNGITDQLKARGWVLGPDGTLTHPSRQSGLRVVGPVEADRTEPAPVGALDGRRPFLEGSAKSLGVRVTLIARRHRLLDPDGHAAAAKPLTDAVAASLGVDDADPAVEWEWLQQQTRGAEGVVVIVERNA